ncbi:nitrate reductase [NADPH] [Methylobacterium phyllosphaerae]|jgi:DMSO/TMAO reductase YedYZ molybdopterin-dependent catalytic subunit|uniref:DMSO/TMAO reductase YedYZ, molybdopterin-dependent catalytic subunit n=2 Tax=Methylobacterium TaxID=407 RepID=A0AAE8HX92_9HYPH|nr:MULTISPECIES: molybdopterin-dependent oxidoreductase [Methylobacterium]AIQ92624.1 Oxidoreductase molybdopterin binding protein [Methylobacterium oryzae CBMB20]APT33020.1 nitrate reductase [NADPH] [Methylobacterium phyllosphaerae]AWV15845.1 oxidase [Methylobacterium sp. XJLW]MDE4911175.1 molybdopterin-dependent oxidoreductase [Methylobacterium sp. 092160098-2]RUP12032.1 MAG: oxidase [Methylobacterium sp.]
MTDPARRAFLKSAALGALAAGSGLRPAWAGEDAQLPFGNGERPLVAYPGKRPLLQTTARPPQLETPFAVFDEGAITPNDAFFVRYHLADIPLEIDPEAFRLTVGGHVERPVALSLSELKALPGRTEIVAVNQCSGNSRGFFEPRMAGGQLGNGAMGCARWTGVPLRSVLDRAGVKAGAVQVAFNGLDRPVLPETPDFAKALTLDQAGDGAVLLAWGMNGEDLPWLNGYPLRLVVPGYYGTYWVKHLDTVTVLDKPFEGFFMKTAYRIPDNPCACTEPGQAAAATVPIGRLNVRSFLTNLADGARVTAGPVSLRGIAFDGGSGIRTVAVSTDDGATWTEAALGRDLGPYAFRPWSLTAALTPGAHAIRVRATANDGSSQPTASRWNPSGYMRNGVETTRVQAA